MARLSKLQKKFLAQQGVPLFKVFDATGLGQTEYREAASALGMVVVYGVTPCKAGGHTLRLRSGHCVECRPAGLGYLLRYDDPGEVYVAHSPTRKVVKIGTSKNADERMRHLKSYQYGGASDWTLVFSQSCEKAGHVEFEAHSLLGNYVVDGTYIKSGSVIECQELFNCSVAIAVKTLRSALKAIG